MGNACSKYGEMRNASEW